MKKSGWSNKTKAMRKVGKVMHEFKEGTLHSGKSDKIVKEPKQAIAIALSEAGLSKKATGGGVKYYTKENEYRLGRPSGSIEKEILDKVTFKNAISEQYFIGSFGWKTTQGKLGDGYLYTLDEFDQDLIKDLKLKSDEKVFRYVNRTTAIGGMTPFIKINLEKSLLYFPVYNDNDDVMFETKGVKPLWINIIEDKMETGGRIDDFSDKIQEGDIVWDSNNKRYGIVLNTYDYKYNEIRLDSDGNQPIEDLYKLGSKGDKGTKAKLTEALLAHKSLRIKWPEYKYEKVNYADGGEVEEEEEMDLNKLSDIQEELGKLYKWKNQYGSKGADGKIKQLEERIEYLKTNNIYNNGGGVEKDDAKKKAKELFDTYWKIVIPSNRKTLPIKEYMKYVEKAQQVALQSIDKKGNYWEQVKKHIKEIESYADGGSIDINDFDMPVIRTQFEDEDYEFEDGGGVGDINMEFLKVLNRYGFINSYSRGDNIYENKDKDIIVFSPKSNTIGKGWLSLQLSSNIKEELYLKPFTPSALIDLFNRHGLLPNVNNGKLSYRLYSKGGIIDINNLNMPVIRTQFEDEEYEFEDGGNIYSRTMKTPDGNIIGKVQYNDFWKTYQVVIDGVVYEEFKNKEEAIENLKNAGFDKMALGGGVGDDLRKRLNPNINEAINHFEHTSVIQQGSKLDLTLRKKYGNFPQDLYIDIDGDNSFTLKFDDGADAFIVYDLTKSKYAEGGGVEAEHKLDKEIFLSLLKIYKSEGDSGKDLISFSDYKLSKILSKDAFNRIKSGKSPLGKIQLYGGRLGGYYALNIANGDFYKRLSEKYAEGGSVEAENKEMVLNNNNQIAHHTKELQSALKGKNVPAWVVAKVNRSATDLSDATHYMEGQGESYADGGGTKSMFNSTKQKMQGKTQQERIDSLIQFVSQSKWSSKPITVNDNMVIVFSKMYDLEPVRVASIFNKYQKQSYADGGGVGNEIAEIKAKIEKAKKNTIMPENLKKQYIEKYEKQLAGLILKQGTKEDVKDFLEVPKGKTPKIVKVEPKKSKEDELAEFTEKIMIIESDILDNLEISSGGEIKQNDAVQKKYIAALDKKINANMFKGVDVNGVRDILEDENYHTLNNYLGLKGYYGESGKNDYKSYYDRNITKGNKIFLNPSFFGSATKTIEPKKETKSVEPSKVRTIRAVAQDKKRTAKKAGKRTAESGNTYYESRENRSDKSQKTRLEKGGATKGWKHKKK